jgi:hypothetical protein
MNEINWDKEPHRVPVTTEQIASKKAWRKLNPPTALSRARALLNDLKTREMAEYSTTIPNKHDAYCEYSLDENDEWFPLYEQAYERIKQALLVVHKTKGEQNGK